MKTRSLLLAILAVQLVLGIVYSFSLPMWQGHEPDFYNVARFLARNGRLPAAADYPDGDAEIRQATQPPLYFLVAAPLVSLFDNNSSVPPGAQPSLICVGDGGLNAPVITYPITRDYLPPVSGAVLGGYALRLLNVALGMVGVLFTYLAGRKLFPNQPAVALVAAALLAFEGSMVRLNSFISNDTLLVTLSAANLLVCAHLADRFRWRTMALLLLSVGLALMTRLGGWALLAFNIPFILLIALAQGRALGRRHARALLAGVGVLVLLAGAVLVFNQLNYGSIFGRYTSLADSIAGGMRNLNLTLPATVSGVFHLTYVAYQEPLQAVQPRAAFVTLYAALLVLGGAGIVVGMLRARGSERRAYLLLIAFLLAAVALVIFRNALATSAENTTFYNAGVLFAPLRYYASGLPAAALLIAAGTLALLPPRLPGSRLNLPGVLVAGCWLAVSGAGAVLALRSQPVSPVISQAAFDALPQSEITRTDGSQPGAAVRVLAYAAREHPAEGYAELTLYLTTDSPLSEEYFAQVQLSASGETSERLPCEFLPARGAYPTTLWQPGEIIFAQAVIPNCAAPVDAPLELSLRWRRAGADGTILPDTDEPPLTLASLSPSFGRSLSCPNDLGVIAGSYQITRFNPPPSITRGVVSLPSVHWLVLSPTPEAAQRVFRFTHNASETSYICSGTPAPQYYTVSLWQRAQEVFFDSCSMRFPADAPTGNYRVAVGMTDVDGNLLPAVDGAGQPSADGWLAVGEVTVSG